MSTIIDCFNFVCFINLFINLSTLQDNTTQHILFASGLTIEFKLYLCYNVMMNFNVTKASFMSVFSNSVYKKIIKESIYPREQIANSKDQFTEVLETLYLDLINSNYTPSSPMSYVYLPKSRFVARIIPILCIRDECFYYFICKVLEEDIAGNRVRNTFGGWRLGNLLKQQEEDDILEIEYVFGSYSPVEWVRNWKEFSRISRSFADSGEFKYALKFDIANYYDCINLNSLENMLYKSVDKSRLWLIPYLMHFLKYWNKTVDNYKPKSVGLPQTEFGDQSRLLANLYLQNYDEQIRTICDQYNAEYVRYADDQIIFLKDDKHINDITLRISKELNALGLNLNIYKTELLTVKELAIHNCYRPQEFLDKEKYSKAIIDIRNRYNKKIPMRLDTILKRIFGKSVGLSKLCKQHRKWVLEIFYKEKLMIYMNARDLYSVYSQLSESERVFFLKEMKKNLGSTKFNCVHFTILSFYQKANLSRQHSCLKRSLAL